MSAASISGVSTSLLALALTLALTLTLALSGLERGVHLGYLELPPRAERVEPVRLLDVEGAQPLEQRAALGAVRAHLPHERCEDRVVVELLRVPVVLVRAQLLLLGSRVRARARARVRARVRVTVTVTVTVRARARVRARG